ncbi:MAG: glycosyltransferase family 4 protein [Candidatus Saccharimonadales bacterium]
MTTKKLKPLKIAMIAPPWLALPIKGYGGIELVIQGLIDELVKIDGVEVELFANGLRQMKGIKTHSFYKEELFETIDLPYYDAPLQVMQTHLNFALKHIEADGGFDIIHDHNPYIGPVYFSLASRIKGVPPVLHTFHGPPFSTTETISDGQADNRPQLSTMNLGNLYMTCISEAMAKQAPKEIKAHLLDAVHNAIEYEAFPFEPDKQNYYITLARFTKDKGQSTAVKFAAKHKKRLRMAGTVAGMSTNRKLMFELSNPLSKYRKNEEFRYYSDKILHYVLKHPRISYSGNLSGKRKMQFLSHAKALLFPIEWDEPFGMAVIEALACGTPVVAMRRGAMPEIIQHGVNGFLADTQQEFDEYALRVDEIDPAQCRKSVEEYFSAAKMAQSYVARYREVLSKQFHN